MNNLKTIDNMKKWKVYYEDKQGELHKCWTEAATKQDAIDDTKSEYWNCYKIIDVMPL